MRGICLLIAVSGAVVCVAGAAPAAWAHGVISREGDVLRYITTNAGVGATLTVTTPETGALVFEDTTSVGGIGANVPANCIPISEGGEVKKARCHTEGIARVEVFFDANNDSVSFDAALPVQVVGGSGNDWVEGGFGADSLDGGAGGDTIIGGAGVDAISAGDGDDSIDIRDGLADTVDCGAGADSVAADLSDPPDLGAASGCESVSVEDRPPDPPPPDTPPDTTITKAPKRETKKRIAPFGFRSSEAGASFECSRDRSPYRPCTAPKRYSNLGLGRHVFKVRSVDAAGNVDPTTASYRWRVVA
jgi:hypothetical protein